jgi:hypothetical protein
LPSVVVLAILLVGWINPFAHAQELPADQPKPEEPRAAQEPGTQAKPKAGEDAGAQTKPNGSQSRGGFDQAVVSAGMAAFERSCTQCHDAARSLDRTKDLAGWRATVRRMAAKRGADIPSADMEPIAVYLASRNAPAAGAATGASEAPTGQGTAGAGAAAPASDTSSLSTFATVSPLWRGGNNDLQNNGFGVLAWVGASWQGKMVSVRATACISCHGVGEPGLISRIEPVEVAVRVDLSTYLDSRCKGMKGSVDAGRIIVPFGAFSAQADPSLYRTVSTPLIFNMGQRLFNQDLGFPVLPMPYADEGVNLNLAVPLGDCGTGPITATGDGYLVNGLEGNGNGIDFLQSRDLYDNNNRVGGGTRVTIGDPYVRAGASFTTGRFDIPGTLGLARGLYYTIYGFDVQAKYKRLFRCQFEYARRDSDRFGILPVGPTLFSEGVYGYYAEAEARPWEKSRVSLLARYDWQSRSSPLAPSGSALPTGFIHVERMTVGVNIELWHQSLFMVDYERWLTPEPGHRTTDVFGIRYTITF